MISFVVPGSVVPWARARGEGSARFTPVRQRSYAGVIRASAWQAMRAQKPLDEPLELRVLAVWPWPTSLSAKRRAPGVSTCKATKPDADNVLKIVKDACTGIVWTDDARVAVLRAAKLYSDRPGLMVTVRPVDLREWPFTASAQGNLLQEAWAA